MSLLFTYVSRGALSSTVAENASTHSPIILVQCEPAAFSGCQLVKSRLTLYCSMHYLHDCHEIILNALQLVLLTISVAADGREHVQGVSAL